MGDDRRGAYTAQRAAALSGVPWSTVHEWSRTGTLVPSVSPVRIKLWSYTDLLGLRTIYWLRHPRTGSDGRPTRKATAMKVVKDALAQLDAMDLEMWEDGVPTVQVDLGGHVHVGKPGAVQDLSGQGELDTLDLVCPFESEADIRGPHLVKPRPHLRIIPGKLSGAPHIESTRLETEAIGSLADRGLSRAKIYRLYPRFEQEGIDDALDLEGQLSKNLGARRALVAA
jgi:uncharacterized protein (DUF433 family)